MAAMSLQRLSDCARPAMRDKASSGPISMAVEMGPDEALSRIAGRAQSDNRWRLIAAILNQSKHDLGNAVKMVDQVMAEYEKLNAATRVSALHTASVIYLAAGQFDRSIDMNKKLLEIMPNDLASLNNLACILVDSVSPPRPREALN